MNVATQGPDYLKVLDHKRGETDLLVDCFTQLASVAIESGGTVSFEWPKSSLGWATDPITQMIVQFQMHSSYPTGCGMGLEIDGKKPLKEWRIGQVQMHSWEKTCS